MLLEIYDSFSWLLLDSEVWPERQYGASGIEEPATMESRDLTLNIPKKPPSFLADELPSSKPFFELDGLSSCPLSFFLMTFSCKIEDFRLVSPAVGTLIALWILGLRFWVRLRYSASQSSSLKPESSRLARLVTPSLMFCYKKSS